MFFEIKVRFTSRPTCGAQEIPGTHPCNVWRLGPSLKTWAKCHAGTSAESHCRIAESKCDLVGG